MTRELTEEERELLVDIKARAPKDDDWPERDEDWAAGRAIRCREDRRNLLAIIDRLTSPAPAQEAGWRPIESAPKDGTPVLLFTTCHGQVEAWFSPGEMSVDHEGTKDYSGDVWVCADDAFQIEVEITGPKPNDYHHGTATHWMPLPTPPTEKE